MNIDIKATELRRVLGTTVLWAAEDDSRPVLRGVHLIVTKPRLWAIGVDPYCCAYDSAECTSDADAEVTLPREAVDFALREIAALPKKVRSEVVVHLTESGISLNPFFLARLHKVARLSAVPISTVVFNGPLGPADIQVGDTFRAIIMPLRVASERNAAELPPAPKAEAA